MIINDIMVDRETKAKMDQVKKEGGGVNNFKLLSAQLKSLKKIQDMDAHYLARAEDAREQEASELKLKERTAELQKRRDAPELDDDDDELRMSPSAFPLWSSRTLPMIPTLPHDISPTLRAPFDALSRLIQLNHSNNNNNSGSNGHMSMHMMTSYRGDCGVINKWLGVIESNVVTALGRERALTIVGDSDGATVTPILGEAESRLLFAIICYLQNEDSVYSDTAFRILEAVLLHRQPTFGTLGNANPFVPPSSSSSSSPRGMPQSHPPVAWLPSMTDFTHLLIEYGMPSSWLPSSSTLSSASSSSSSSTLPSPATVSSSSSSSLSSSLSSSSSSSPFVQQLPIHNICKLIELFIICLRIRYPMTLNSIMSTCAEIDLDVCPCDSPAQFAFTDRIALWSCLLRMSLDPTLRDGTFTPPKHNVISKYLISE
jgi:hypothetical protein